MAVFKTLALLFTLALATSSVANNCTGQATYRVILSNMLTAENFGELIPEVGLNFSPMAAASHSNRLSFLTIRGYASPQVEQIAETGDNGRFIKHATDLRNTGRGVFSVASGILAGPGANTTAFITVNCEHPFITALSMIAPSPDWIVQINNRNMVDDTGAFVKMMSGNLIAYDTGVDDGREFTSPVDASLDMPSEPSKNIAPLVEDETDRFEGRNVGRFYVVRTM